MSDTESDNIADIEASDDSSSDNDETLGRSSRSKSGFNETKNGSVANANNNIDEIVECDKIHSEQTEELSRMKAEQISALTAACEAGDKRLAYLIAQSEIFTHFLCGEGQLSRFSSTSKASSASSRNKGTGGRKSRTRLNETAEDDLLVKLSDEKSVRLSKQPTSIRGGQLRSYQLDGLNWLARLYDHGVNGILADEMGLGKTIQTISLLAYLKQYRRVVGPHLIIVPKSTVTNWCREIAKWCPSLTVLKLAGSREERKAACNLMKSDDFSQYNIVVANYEAAMREKGPLKRIEWNYLIIDEAHRIKNRESSLSQLVRLLTCRHRLLVTGTPLQNNLHELWSLLNFLLPDVFESSESFDSMFDISGSDEAKDNVMKKLHIVLKPFMLRRVKSDVEKDLPPKTETKIHVGLSSLQKEWYIKVLTKESISLNILGGPDKSRLMNTLVQLRKVCNHPYLFQGAECGPPFVDGSHLWESSGKMSVLHKLLAKLRAQNHRVLIYSQMVRMLDILEDYLIYTGYEYCRIDGSNDGEEREDQIDRFNAQDSSKIVFLLSTRAGGLGLNLATADTVILFDSDWNPQVDLQAMDRAHRIGQTKPVRVFRFISDGTLEEKICERAERKLYLDALVIQQGRFVSRLQSGLSRGELMAMVKFGAQEILSSREGSITDEDLDSLLRRSDERTAEESERIKQNMDYSLSNFSIEDDCSINVENLLKESEFNIFSLDGSSSSSSSSDNVAKKTDDPMSTGVFVQLPQRERRHNYDVDGYYKEKLELSDTEDAEASSSKKPSHARKPKKASTVQIHDFQFINKAEYDRITAEDKRLAESRLSLISIARDLFTRDARERRGMGLDEMANVPEYCIKSKSASLNRTRMANDDDDDGKKDVGTAFSEELRRMFAQIDACVLPEEMRQLLDQIIGDGFINWSRKEFKAFSAAYEKHGGRNEAEICNDVVHDTGLLFDDVSRYLRTFVTRFREFPEGNKLVEKVERSAMKTQRTDSIKREVDLKMARHLSSAMSKLPGEIWQTLRIDYGANKGRLFSEEEDCFLLYCVYKFGYGNWDKYRCEIRGTWQFQFDWYFKSRTSVEIQRRVDILVKLIEKENLLVAQLSDPNYRVDGEPKRKRKHKTVSAAEMSSQAVVDEQVVVEEDAEVRKRSRIEDDNDDQVGHDDNEG